MNLSWSWGCDRKHDGSPQAHELPPRSSSASKSSSASSTGSSSLSSQEPRTERTGTSSGLGSTARPSQTSGSEPTAKPSASSRSTSQTISGFVTSTRPNSCTYSTPSLAADGPYCSFYVSAHSASQCNFDDGKTYAPYTYTDDACQPVCPLTSPGDGYSQIEQPSPTTTTSEFWSFTTTDVVGNVKAGTSLSAIDNGIPGSACVGPTIQTAATGPAASPPPPSLLPQGQKTYYVGSEFWFDHDDVRSKIRDVCRQMPHWYSVKEVYYKGEIKRYTRDGGETDDATVSIAVLEDDRACPEALNLDSEFGGALNSDVCEENLMGTVDGCDTNSETLKHGGILWANSLSWEVRIDAS